MAIPTKKKTVEFSEKILLKGDLNPHVFYYPSLPIYVIAGGLTAGYFYTVSCGLLRKTSEIGDLTGDFFKFSRIVFPAKLIYIFFGMFAMIIAGLIAYAASREIYLLFLAPLFLSFSAVYFYYSHRYINVDVMGAFLVMALYLFLLLAMHKDTYYHKAIIPGVLCGLAAATKYNLALTIVPALLMIVFFSGKQRFAKMLYTGLVMGLVFVVVVPFSLLDFNTFVNHVGSEIYHYTFGHKGFEAEPGIKQLAYYFRTLLNDYGYFSIGLFFLGLYMVVKKNWKYAVTFLSFPLIFLVYMSTQKVHFVRNILFVYILYAILLCLGVKALYDLLKGHFERIPLIKRWCRHKRMITLVVVIVVVLFSVKLTRYSERLEPAVDSRKQAIKWIKEHVAKDATLIVPAELHMRTIKLKGVCATMIMPYSRMNKHAFCKYMSRLRDAYVILPRFGYDTRWPSAAQAQETAKKLNGFRDCFDIVKTFENKKGQKVIVNHYFENPIFSIGRVKSNLQNTLPGNR